MPAELSISISEGLMERLNSLADEVHCSKEELVAVAVERLVEDEKTLVAQVLRGIREAEAGLVIEHHQVMAWIDSLGTEHELPRPSARAT